MTHLFCAHPTNTKREQEGSDIIFSLSLSLSLGCGAHPPFGTKAFVRHQPSREWMQILLLLSRCAPEAQECHSAPIHSDDERLGHALFCVRSLARIVKFQICEASALIYATGVAAQRAHFSPMPKCCWTKSTGRLSLADAALHFWEADENSIYHITHTQPWVVGLFARGDVAPGLHMLPLASQKSATRCILGSVIRLGWL